MPGSPKRRLLVTGDPSEHLAQLRDELDVFVQKADAAKPPAGPFTGVDGSGTITVTMDEARVRDVAVSRAWREAIAASDLAAAVAEAVTAAVAARLRGWGDAVAEQEEAPDPRPRPMDVRAQGLAHQLDELTTRNLNSAQGLAALAELLAMVEAVERGIDEASARIDQKLEATYTGVSRARKVRVTVKGTGEFAGAAFDRRWLVDAHEYNIGRQATEAFRDAYRQLSENPIGDVVADTALGDVMAAGSDPLELARRLRLRADG